MQHYTKKPRQLSTSEQIEISLRQIIKRQNAALAVIVLTPRIRDWLFENDPKALQQCLKALGLDKGRMCTREEAYDFAALFTDQP